MSEKKQNLNFVTPNKDQQKIFQDYLGKKLGTKALLVLEQEIEDKQTSYNFIYQYPDQLQLASFLIVLDSDERLVSLASNIVTDASSAYAINIQDFILEYVKKTVESKVEDLINRTDRIEKLPSDLSVNKQNITSIVEAIVKVISGEKITFGTGDAYQNTCSDSTTFDPKLDDVECNAYDQMSIDEKAEFEKLNKVGDESDDSVHQRRKTYLNYYKSSQATYFFDCDGEGIKDGNINPKSSKGSFCCILKKYNSTLKIDEYFILTARHNLQSSGSYYKLIKDAKNFVELELITDYRETFDAAILRINKCNGVSANDLNKQATDGSGKPLYKDINGKWTTVVTTVVVLNIETLDFYESAIKPNNFINPSKGQLIEDNGNTVGFLIGIPIDEEVSKILEITKISYNGGSKDYSVQLKNKLELNLQGMSGGLVLTSKEMLIGNFKGPNNDNKCTYFNFTDYNFKLI